MKNNSMGLLIILPLGLTISSCKKDEYRGPENWPPIAEAGPNQTIVLPTNSVALRGSGRDAEGAIAQYEWTKVSGPAAYNIVDNRNPATMVTDLEAGNYTFQLKVVVEGGLSATDRVTVFVLSNTGDPCAGCWDYGTTVPKHSANSGQ